MMMMKRNRADKLLELVYFIINEYHEEMFEVDEKHPKMLEQVIRHDAWERFGIEDLNYIEIGFVKKMIRSLAN